MIRLLILALLSLLFACAPTRGSSFETLGVPRAERSDGDGAIVIGWAHEDRGSWSLQKLRLDGERGVESWDRASQRPIALSLAAGEHELQLYVAAEREGRVRRLKLRPVRFALGEGQVRLCAIEVDDRRRRPRVSCEHYTGARPRRQARRAPREPERTEGATSASAVESAVESADDSARSESRANMSDVIRRLERIEARLAELVPEDSGERRPPPVDRSRLRIDTEYPESARPEPEPYRPQLW